MVLIPIVQVCLINQLSSNIISDKNGSNFLHICAEKGYAESMVQLDKVDKNLKNANGKTPLHAAVENGHFQCMKILVEHGADKRY